MSTQVRHFVFTGDGLIREVSAEQAALVASGNTRMPEFADSSVRYVQLMVQDEAGSDNDIRVETSGARIRFDADGRLTEAGQAPEAEQISRFEHDAIVQWALRDMPVISPTFH